MSFSSEVKEELSHVREREAHCRIAELAAIISLCGRIECEAGHHSVVLHTENVAVARRFYSLIKEVFQTQPQVSSTHHDFLKKNRFYKIAILDSGAALRILKAVRLINSLGQMDEEFSVRDNPVLQRTCCRRAFLRGAFLSAGSITDPEKNYHFEIACAVREKAEQLRELFAFFGLDAKIVMRKKYYVLYLKEGAMISDALNIMEAHVALMRFENVRILKDVRNSVNRRVNCEAANINKTVSAARKQIEDIEYIKNTVGLERLPANLRDIAAARLAQPDATLKELGESLPSPVGKSGVNHRLRKLGQIAQNIREKGHR